MKPFDLEKAKAGAPVQTRDGRKVRILCWDRKGEYPIIGLVLKEGKELIFSYIETGSRHKTGPTDEYDLVMAPVEKTVWVNLFRAGGQFYCSCWESKEEAQSMDRQMASSILGTFPITYQES